jgi:uncharacterized cupredoxin-like copper-binding protein
MHRSRVALSAGAGLACLVAGLVWALFLVPAAPAKTATRAVTSTIIVTAGKPSEFAFKLSKRQVPAGTVIFKVTNSGKVPHTFEVCSSAAGTTKPNTCKGRVTKSLAPGKSQTLTLTLKKGKYEYLCTVPGHAKLGMKGVVGIAVTPPPPPPPPTTTTTATTTTTPTTTKTCANPQTTNVDVNMFDYGFTITPSSAPCGKLVITQRNTGNTDHNFNINGQAGAIIGAGQSSTFTANLTPGSWSYQCDVPGHVGLGMGGTMTITG